MDKSKLVEDLITTRLLNGNVMEFVTELKQANVTATEAKTADLFGDPKIGELVGNIIENIDNMDAITPTITELREYLDKSDKPSAEVGGVKENFAMEGTKVENEIQKNVEENVVKADEIDVKALMEKVDGLEKTVAQFSEMKKTIEKMSNFMFAESDEDKESDKESEDKESESEEDEGLDIDSDVKFSEDGSVTITMSKGTYDKLRTSMANIRNFAEEAEEEDTIAIPKSEYKQLMYDLGKAEARADLDSAKAYEETEAPTEENHAEEVCPTCGKTPCECDKHEDKKEDDIDSLKAELAEMKEMIAKLSGEKKEEMAEEPTKDDLPVEDKDPKNAPVADTPVGTPVNDKVSLSDEEKEALKEEIKEDVKEDLISAKAAKPESLSDDEKDALESNFSESVGNDTFEWLFGDKN